MSSPGAPVPIVLCSCLAVNNTLNPRMYQDHGHEHVNGHQVNGEQQPTEEELDAYQSQLTNEAIQDQVKVPSPTFTPLPSLTDAYRPSSSHKKNESFYTTIMKSLPLLLGCIDSRAFRQHMLGETSDAELAGIISSSTNSFNDLSQRINRCENALKDDLDRGDLAGMIRRIQDNEKIKLEAVPPYSTFEADGRR